MKSSRFNPVVSRAALIAVCALPATLAQAQIDTGPRQQSLPWRAQAQATDPFHRFNSVVEISTPGVGIGTGTIVGKRLDADPAFAWYAVLTADHVVNPAAATGNSVINFGDNAANGSNGGLSNIIRRAPLPAAQGGMGLPIDLAVIGIRAPKDAFFTHIAEVGMVATTPSSAQNTSFTQPGYGRTGQFVAAAAPLPAGMTTQNNDHTKRFQNNSINSQATANYTDPDSGQNYNYTAIQYTFDQPAAPGAHGTAHNFLVAEGTSYAGDSGGPYLTSAADKQLVGNFARPGAGSDWDFGAAHPEGDFMAVNSNAIFAVHAFGANPPGGWPGGVVPYGRIAGGVPLTQANIDWINTQIGVIPSPATAGLLAMGGLIAARRRRG